MDQQVITARTRTESGKKAARDLRKQGRLPAVVYNTKGRSEMIDVDAAEFEKIWRKMTPTTLVSLSVDGKTGNLAFVKDTQYDIIQDDNLHADFYVIEEDKPLKVTIKAKVTGNPVGVRDGGVLEHGSVSVDIECLPKDLPPAISADVSNLKLGETFLVKNLSFGPGVKVLSDEEQVVAVVKSIKD